MIELGEKVREMASGFIGTAVARCDYLNATTRYQVQPIGTQENGSMSKAEWIDEGRLTVQ